MSGSERLGLQETTRERVVRLLVEAGHEVGDPSRDGYYYYLTRAPREVVLEHSGELLFLHAGQDAIKGLENAAEAMVVIAEADSKYVEELVAFVEGNSQGEFDERLPQYMAAQNVIEAIQSRNIEYTTNQIERLWKVAKKPLDYDAAHSKNPPQDKLIIAAAANVNEMLARVSDASVAGILTQGVTYYAIMGSPVVVEAASETLQHIFDRKKAETLGAVLEVQDICRLDEWMAGVRVGLIHDKQKYLLDVIDQIYTENRGEGDRCLSILEQAFEFNWTADLRESSLTIMQDMIATESRIAAEAEEQPNKRLVGRIAEIAMERTDEPGSADLRTMIGEGFPDYQRVVDPGKALREFTAELESRVAPGG